MSKKEEQTENLCTTNHLQLQNIPATEEALLTGNGDHKPRALDPERQEATSQCTSPASSNLPLRLKSGQHNRSRWCRSKGHRSSLF